MNRSILARLLAPLLVMAVLALAAGQADRFTIVIFHVNDLHAATEGLQGIAAGLAGARNDAGTGRCPELGAVPGRPAGSRCVVLALNAGDSFSGNPMIDLLAGEPLGEIFRIIAFDATVIGNHDFDYGQEALMRVQDLATDRWLGANLGAGSGALLEQPPASVVLESAGGLRVGVIGVVQIGAAGIPSTAPKNLAGLSFTDPVAAMREEARRLRPVVDVLIGLTHLGVDWDVELAGAVPELDAIVGGHSHTTLSGPLFVTVAGKRIPIVQAGSGGRVLGRLDLDVRGGRVEGFRGRLISTHGLGEDPVVAGIIAAAASRVKPVLDRVVGQAGQAIARSGQSLGDSPLGNLIADAFRAAEFGGDLAASIGITNNGGIRADLPRGQVTLEDLYQVMPFGNGVVLVQLSGGELRELIRYSFARRNQVDLQVSGMTYTIVTDVLGQVRRVEISVAGEALDDSGAYLVAMNDFMASGGSGYPVPAPSIIAAAGRTDALVVADYLERLLGGAIAVESDGRIRVRR